MHGNVCTQKDEISMAKFIEKIRLLKGLLTGEKAYAGPFYVTVDVTRRCNLRCPGCRFHSSDLDMPGPGNQAVKDLPLTLFQKLCNELKSMDTHAIILIGEGEPFLYPQIFDCIDIAKSADLHVTLLTNGTLLNEKNIQALLDSQLDILKVSLWASSMEEYQQNYPGVNPEYFNKIVKGLNLIFQAKKDYKSSYPSVTLHHPITRQNYHDIDAMIDLAHRTGCNTLSFSPFKNRRGELSFHEIPQNEELNLRKTLDSKAKKLASMSINHNIEQTLLRYRIGEAVWKKIPCYIGWLHARIKVDGTVLPCNPCDLVMGNLHESSFKEIWNGSAYQKFRKKTITRKGLESHLQDCDCGFCCLLGDNVRMHRVYKWFSWLRRTN
jgi:radical SAM protein with 4Fe4S-binding SPASM domain